MANPITPEERKAVADELLAVRDKYTMACPDKPHTPFAVLTRAHAALTAAEAEIGALRLAILGGEDAPGVAMSVSHQYVLDVQCDNMTSYRSAFERSIAAEARATKAEGERDKALDVLARVRVMFRLDLPKMLTFGRNYNQAVKDVSDAVDAALQPSSPTEGGEGAYVGSSIHQPSYDAGYAQGAFDEAQCSSGGAESPCADAGTLPALAQECRAFILQIARMGHGQDAGVDPSREPDENLDHLIAQARELSRGWKIDQPFEKMVEGEDGWSEWRRPLPGYLMKCCDCGLVHEMDFAVVRQGRALEGGYFESEDVDDPSIFAMFRARRAAPDGGEAVHGQVDGDKSRDAHTPSTTPDTSTGEDNV